jgi:UDP-N-acetylmuramoyl-tripeptide--D-alanyl-D-alanine ligase
LEITALYRLYLESGGKISTDTRKEVQGSLFFALNGANFKGSEFVEAALDKGCAYAITDSSARGKDKRIVQVPDPLQTLQQLAQHHRQQLKIPVLGITGSNGKTTTKELINAVLSRKFKVLATAGNLNNHIGVPLTLLQIKPEHELAIIEMGANRPGEIDMLCRIADPDYGLITNIGKAHLEGFGSIEGVKAAKSELYRYLKPKGGKAFVNGDDDVLSVLAFENDKITYGCKRLYDVIGKNLLAPTVTLKYTTRYGEKDWSRIGAITTQIHGGYNFTNCLAAACVGNYFKVQDEDIRYALENYLPGMNRSQIVNTERNTLILDAYNANPDSMMAAIENFADGKDENKLLVIGDMFELGSHSRDEHERVVELLSRKNLKHVILVGREFAETTSPFRKFSTTEECLDYLKKNEISGMRILIKGSRGMKMELLREAL